MIKGFKLNPLKDENGRIVTNREMALRVLNTLKQVKEVDKSAYYKIMRGSQQAEQTEKFIEQVANAASDDEANIILRDYLLKN